MALSAAEKQRRYRDRQKTSPSSSEVEHGLVSPPGKSSEAPEAEAAGSIPASGGTDVDEQLAEWEALQAERDKRAVSLGMAYAADESNRREENSERRTERRDRAIRYQRWLLSEGKEPA